jgi:hypothetical protein
VVAVGSCRLVYVRDKDSCIGRSTSLYGFLVEKKRGARGTEGGIEGGAKELKKR